MSYYSQGIALSQEPDEAFLAGIPGRFGYRIYRHNLHPIWLIELLDARSADRDAPFTYFCGDDFVAPSLAEPAAALSVQYPQILSAIVPIKAYGGGWLQLTSYLSMLTSDEVFFFASDDEMINFACRAKQGEVGLLCAELDSFDLRLKADGIHVHHVLSLEDQYEDEVPVGPHYDSACLRCERLAALAWLHVDPISEIDGGRVFYRIPLEAWPKQWGDAQRLFGLGTWDPFGNIRRDYQVAFQRLPALP